MESPRKESRWRHLRRHTPRPTATTASSAASPPAVAGAVLKQGFLLKKGHRLPTTKERFFELRPQLLSYFRTKHGATSETTDAVPDARQLRGVIELAPSDLITPIATSRHWLILQKRSGPDGKSYKLELRASSPEERQQWIDALRAAARDSAVVNPTQAARQAERERQATRTLTMLHVRDASLLSTVLRQHASSSSNALPTSSAATLVSSPSVVDLRASFQVFHELVLLQSLVSQVKASWGAPSSWSCDQYDLLVDSIALAQQRTASSTSSVSSSNDESETKPQSVLSEARALQYAFEEVPANQHKLLTRQQDPQPTSRRSSVLSDSFTGRVRCPTIYSYLSTFERLAPSDSDQRISSDSGASSARSSWTSEAEGMLMSPRSATLAKYAHLYLEEEGRNHKPWSWERDTDDELTPKDPATSKDAVAAALTQQLIGRYTSDRIYSSLRHHMLLFVNPNRMLKTSKFTSIYDEQVVLVYAQTPYASTQLASHPFAMAKQALFRLFFSKGPCQSLLLSGDSGSGKTELSKELLKYVVLTAQPSTPGSIRAPKIVLYTSSTKSTLQMRHDETRTLELLHAKGIIDYEVVLLDLQPERWDEMTSVSKSKRLPQVHIDCMFFGFYETLQRLEDEEQLRMYLRNPHVAKKLSAVLDSNILLEAFAHATTALNGNSSRYAKSVDVQVAYGRDPALYQVVGCVLTPFLLEKSRVTSANTRNFHVLYALVHGLNTVSGNGVIVPPHFTTLSQQLHLQGCSSETFRYLDGAQAAKTTSDATRESEWKKAKDFERFQNILMAMETVAIDAGQQEAIFRVLSAILWLGNLDFKADEGSKTTEIAFVGLTKSKGASIASTLQQLLALDSMDTLRSLLLLRRVEMKATGEAFDVKLSVGQAQHARDTLARSLYQTVFQYVVSHLNRATQCEDKQNVRCMRILDLFGFENFADSHANSLEQLCINYLTEKFATAEQKLLATTVYAVVEKEPVSEPLLAVFENSLGIFATLEEQTVLHQSDIVAFDLEQKKNDLFVRYLYQRNASQLVPQPSQLKQDKLLFLVPHSRSVVTYDATDFVAKNSDFQQQWSLLSSLETTQHAGIRSMVQEMTQQAKKSSQANGDAPSSTRTAAVAGSSGSLTTQFRAQIQQQVATLTQETSGPLFLHCLKPSASAFVHAADAEVVKRQVAAQRLDAMALLCTNDLAYELSMDASIFLSRYRCLVRPGPVDGIDALCVALTEQLCGVLDIKEESSHGSSSLLHVDGGFVRVRTLQAAETLELLLSKHQFEAATRIQAQARMLRAWKWYNALQTDRKALAHELLAIYGPNSTRKIERTLRKYQGREHELMEKIEAKKLEKQANAELAKGMESILGQVSMGNGGFLDPQLLEHVLRDPEIQSLLAKSDRVVVALREMSLNPQQVLPKQLQDPELRVFYQRMLTLLQASVNEHSTQQDGKEGEDTEILSTGSLEDRVRLLVVRHKRVWQAVAGQVGGSWEDVKDKLEEIGDEPEMLLFYSDDDEFVETLTRYVEAVESEVKSGGASKGDEEDEAPMKTLLAKLKLVELNATLMAAMQGDPFFVEALQSPQLVSAVHQLMTDREAVTAETSLQTPLMVEFFTRLVRLSEETRKHRS